MKDGYYISMYCDISQLANLYQWGHRHDNCIALWKKTNKNIDLVHYWELERLSGQKQQRIAFFDIEHCNKILNELLKRYSLTVDNIEEIWGVPILNSNDSYLSKYKFPDYTYHTVSHLASGLFLNMEIFKNEKILAIAVDGGPDSTIDSYDINGRSEQERYAHMGCYSPGRGEEIQPFQVTTPAGIWGLASLHYQMREGSLMALASASESKTNLQITKIPRYHTLAYTKDDKISEKMIKEFEEIESLTEVDIGSKFNFFDPRFDEKDNKISMVMKIIQDMSYEIMEDNIDYAIEKYNIIPEETYLAMSGGFALNCPCNTYLMDKYKFKGFIAPPCVSDSGMALGIGLYSFYQEMGADFDFRLKNACYGDDDNIENFLKEGKYIDYIKSVKDFEPDQVVIDMEKEPIVWFDGKAELGPRALGARSILGDPRKNETKDKLNEIKLRQWWRPVAPIAKSEKMGEWFEQGYESPYMLHAFQIKDSKKGLVPAIMHEDGSARVQSLDKEGGRLRQVIDAFESHTGIPIICNTSLNDKGEPIINRIEEAFNFALRKGMTIGYFNGKRIEFTNHKMYEEKEPLLRPLDMSVWEDKQQWDTLLHKYNPLKWPAKITTIYIIYYLGKGRELIEFSEEEQTNFRKMIEEHLDDNPLTKRFMLISRMETQKYLKKRGKL